MQLMQRINLSSLREVFCASFVPSWNSVIMRGLVGIHTFCVLH